MRRILIGFGLGVALLSGAVASADEIVIGASLPLSGQLASFGAFQRWGYEHAIAEANHAGGIAIGGKRLPVRLVVRDDRS